MQKKALYLILVVDVGVRQLASDELIQDNAKGIHIGLERVWVRVLHTDHFWSLRNHNNVTKQSTRL